MASPLKDMVSESKLEIMDVQHGCAGLIVRFFLSKWFVDNNSVERY